MHSRCSQPGYLDGGGLGGGGIAGWGRGGGAARPDKERPKMTEGEGLYWARVLGRLGRRGDVGLVGERLLEAGAREREGAGGGHGGSGRGRGEGGGGRAWEEEGRGGSDSRWLGREWVAEARAQREDGNPSTRKSTGGLNPSPGRRPLRVSPRSHSHLPPLPPLLALALAPAPASDARG